MLQTTVSVCWILQYLPMTYGSVKVKPHGFLQHESEILKYGSMHLFLFLLAALQLIEMDSPFRYGIHDMEASAKRIYETVLGTPEDHVVLFLAHNGPTGLSTKIYSNLAICLPKAN